MSEIEIFERLGMALAIGLMIGVERGWETRNVPDGTRIAGIRSYTMMGLLGGLWGLLGQFAGPAVTGIAFAAFVLLIVAAHVMQLRNNPAERSIAPVLASLLAFALGALAAYGHLMAAAAAGVVTLALLTLKAPLHRFVDWIEPATMKAAVQLLVISVVLLPVLPNQGYGPEESVNPFRVWWVVVMIAAIGFVGYIAIKVAGTRIGAMLTAAFGGMASSTVLALNFARMGRATPELRRLLAAGVAVASTLMAVRILGLAAVLNPDFLGALAVPMGAMTVVGLAGAGLLWLGARDVGVGAETPVANPFEFWTAIKLALFLSAVLLLAAVMHQHYGSGGVDLVAAIAGLADVDAITVSMSHATAQGTGAAGGMTMPAAALAVSIAAIVNTLVKAAIVIVVGGWPMGRQMVLVAIAMSVAAGLGLLIAS